MKFPLARFTTFCNELTIDSKEMGLVTLSKLLGTQQYHLEQIVTGLEDGVHFFVECKARQLGITTVQLALDLFWHYEYPGMQGTLASDNDDNKAGFRSTLTQFHDGLPKTHRLRMVHNNRDFMEFENRSRMFMQVGGGVKRKGGKGRGKGIIFIHGTEVSSWEDEESLASILASLAETNPYRLAVWESTARGFNMFHDMYEEATDAITQRAIFNGWWRNELYRKESYSQEYQVYWDGNLTGVEREWVDAVRRLYDFEICPEQIAWYRWKLAESIHDENLMLQEFPPTAELAFILTGKNFFTLSRVHEMAERIEQEPPPLECLRMSFGDEFMKTTIEASPERTAQLRIWEQPDDNAFYVIGADPAYGSASWADRSVAEVWRCYADRFEQVAEFCSAEITTYKFAWVLCYLSGAYKNSMVNCELNGPGEAVIGEIDNLRRQASVLGGSPAGKALRDVVGHMRYFLYRRLDSPFGGAVYHWKALALDTPIPTPTGWTTMGRIQEGNYVLDNEGFPTQVLHTSQVYYDRPCYRLTFDDHTSIVCDADHLWPTFKSGVKKTSDLDEGDGIALTEPLKLDPVPLSIDPYVLGAWLGDGNSSGARMYGTEEDLTEIVTNVLAAGYRVGEFQTDKRNRTIRFSIYDLSPMLRREGLIKNKHIPFSFLRGSFEQRLSLLQGLMDTDGSISSDRQCSFTTTSRALFDGFSELLRTLGIKVKSCVRHRTVFYKGEYRQCVKAYQFYFTAYPEMPVFRLSRKLAKQQDEKSDRRGKSAYRHVRTKQHIIVSIDEVESVPVRCIEVNSVHHLYLSGEGMIPTHNTTQETKERAFNTYRDIVEKGWGVVHSKILVEEMKIVVREKDGFLGASGRGKDDCTVASAIAAECYTRYIVTKLKQMGVTWAKERDRRARAVEVGREETPVEAAMRRSVGGYMGSLGIKYGPQ